MPFSYCAIKKYMFRTRNLNYFQSNNSETVAGKHLFTILSSTYFKVRAHLKLHAINHGLTHVY